jgi:hypothetical protein
MRVTRLSIYFLFCFSSLTCFADSESPEEETLTAPPPPIGYQPEKVTTQPKGLITPTVEPRVDEGFGFWIDGDFIWWKSRLSNFDYAQMNGKTISPHFSFEPGFKIGTGMDLQHDGWDGYAEYTWLYEPTLSNSQSFHHTYGYSSLILPFAEGETEGTLSSISLMDAASWRKSQFNILDVEIGRNFFISKRLTLRPNMGIKAAALFEKTKIIYTSASSIASAHLLLKQNLAGVGPRLGMDTLWHITKGFGIYADAAFTAFWGSFHNTLNNRYELAETFSSSSYSVFSNTQDILPVLEAGLGLSYMVWFKEKRYQLYLKAGWEEQIWIGYNKNRVNGLNSADGSLTLQGLTAQAGFAF